jgi:hypothetical protein
VCVCVCVCVARLAQQLSALKMYVLAYSMCCIIERVLNIDRRATAISAQHNLYLYTYNTYILIHMYYTGVLEITYTYIHIHTCIRTYTYTLYRLGDVI